MANKMLGKVVAGAALGGAGLLVFTPGMASADGHHEDEGKVIAKPHVVRAGDEVKLLEICPEPQEHAFVWSKVTGKVKLQPVREDHGDEQGRGQDDADYGPDGKDRYGRGEEGRGDERGGHEHGGPQTPVDGAQPPADGGQPDDTDGGVQPPAGGTGGGMSADWGSEGGDLTGPEEYGQDAASAYGHPGDPGSRGAYGTDSGYGADSEYGMTGGYGMSQPGRGEDWGSWDHKKDFVYYGEATVSEDAEPGTYKLKGSCGEGELVVLPFGPVDGGDGGMATTSADRGMVTGGAGMIGAAALGGIVLLRRRRANDLV